MCDANNFPGPTHFNFVFQVDSTRTNIILKVQAFGLGRSDNVRKKKILLRGPEN